MTMLIFLYTVLKCIWKSKETSIIEMFLKYNQVMKLALSNSKNYYNATVNKTVVLTQ